MANKSNSNRSASSKQNQGSKRPGGYSERYSNRPNPYTGYLPPGAASSEHIYHPESVDPVRIKQLEREQEQARLHAYEERANMPHTESAPAAQSTASRQPQQVSHSQSSRSAQEAARRGKQTRRAQVAQQQAAKAGTAQRRTTVIENNAHLNKIRQNAIDEAEKLRSQPAEPGETPVISDAAKTESAQKVPVENTSTLPVAGAAQFAAINNKKKKNKTPPTPATVVTDIEEEEKAEDNTASVEAVPVVIPSAPIEVINPDAASETSNIVEDVPVVEDVEDAETVFETPAEEPDEETEAITSDDTEAETESNDEAPASVIPIEEIPSDSEVLSDTSEDEEKQTEDESTSVITEPEEISEDNLPEETAAVPEEESEEEASDNASEEIITEDIVAEEPSEEEEEEEEDGEVTESIDSDPDSDSADISDEDEPSEEEEDDVKVYVPTEKAVEEDEYHDDAEEDNAEEYMPAPAVAISTPPKRRNFETRISSDLADPSTYSPGVAQDETLFIRKTRPEEATAVFSASTPGLAPDFDDDDFFEQWLEEGDDMIIKDKRQRRKVSAIIGAVTMAFAIIGFIFVIAWFIKGIPTGSNTSGTQTDYAKFILPVVNADPEPFETITSVDNNILVEAAINRLTYGEAAADQIYTALEVENETRLLIPASDVEKSGKVLFGDTFTIDYTVMYAIEDEMIYYYSAADNCFHVVTTSGDIEPEIIKISHIGSRTQVLLEVGYISATEETMEGSEYYKEMEYVLNSLDDGSYYVSAIRAIKN